MSGSFTMLDRTRVRYRVPAGNHDINPRTRDPADSAGSAGQSTGIASTCQLLPLEVAHSSDLDHLRVSWPAYRPPGSSARRWERDMAKRQPLPVSWSASGRRPTHPPAERPE